MPLPLINVLGSAALTAATPFLSKALQGLMGGSEAERERERALAETERVAQGGTTQGQAGMAYARSRALQDLAQQAQRGTAQQQAGLARDAMTAGADAQARYASQLAELRSREQERAREAAAYLRNQKAREDALIARQTASKFAEGALTPLVQQLVTPGASSAGLTPEEAAAYNEANTRGSAASGDLGAAFEQRTRELATGTATPVVAPVVGGVTSAGAASALGLEPGARVGGMSQTTYQQRTGMPGVTDRERALNPSQQVADLQAQRTLATANIAPGPVAPGSMVDYTKGMGEGGDFATLADRQVATSAMSPFMKSPAEQGAAASLAPTKTPMAFSYEGEQVEGLRKARPGRMPRKPGQTVRGGGGYAF